MPKFAEAQWVQTNGPYGGAIWCFTVSGTNLFAGTTGGVFLSTDNGTRWTAANTGLMNTLISALVASGTNLFAGTFDYTTRKSVVFLSTNNGKDWTIVNTGLPNNSNSGITSITALGVNGTNLFAGVEYSDVWRRSIPEIIASVGVSPTEQPASFTLEQNHPNPFTTSTTISFTLTERGMATLDVFDVLGRKVRTLVNGMMDVGPHSVEFDAKNLSEGVYTAKMTVNGVEREMKTIKIRN